jgi:hypothetical protein
MRVRLGGGVAATVEVRYGGAAAVGQRQSWTTGEIFRAGWDREIKPAVMQAS